MKKFSSLLGFVLVLFCFTAAMAMELPENFVLRSTRPEQLTTFAVSPDNQTLAVRGVDYIQLWNIATQTLTKTFRKQRKDKYNTRMTFTPDGKNLMEIFPDAPDIVVTSIESGKIVFEKSLVDIYSDPLNRFSPSGNELLVYDNVSGYADLIDMKTWKTLSTTFIGKRPYPVIYYTGFYFVDQNTILVQYNDDSQHNSELLFKYKLGTKEIIPVKSTQPIMYFVQMSPTTYVGIASIVDFFYDACTLDITTGESTKFYENEFLPPNDSPVAIHPTIDTLQYDPKNDVLLIGTALLKSVPKGLRLVDMKTKRASPSFGFKYLKEIKLFSNDSDNYIIGINDGKNHPKEGGIQFIKVSR
jgi:hypothetical protein